MILILRHLLYRDSILPVRRYLKTLNRLKNSLALVGSLLVSNFVQTRVTQRAHPP